MREVLSAGIQCTCDQCILSADFQMRWIKRQTCSRNISNLPPLPTRQKGDLFRRGQGYPKRRQGFPGTATRPAYSATPLLMNRVLRQIWGPDLRVMVGASTRATTATTKRTNEDADTWGILTAPKKHRGISINAAKMNGRGHGGSCQ